MEKMLFGRISDADVHKISLEVGIYRIEVLTYGANLAWYGTKEQNFVLCHNNLEEYIDDPSYQ
ncbi:MAG: hypothetical protein II339_00115, partial [Spirochaetales bacterium]|nr:hypothetical protein [Spirochaetales bacterium]